MKKIIIISILCFTYSCSIKQDSNLEMMLDNFLDIYSLDKNKEDIYVNEIQTDNDSILGVGIYVGSKIPNNSHSYDELNDDDFYFSNYKGYRIYLRKYFIEDNILVNKELNKKKKIENNLNWEKGKLKKPKNYLPSVSDIFESISFSYNFKKNIILDDVNVVGYKRIKVNSSYPFIEVDTTSCINLNYYR